MLNLPNCLILSLILFVIGVYGVIARRNMLIMLMSIEIMLNAANLAFIAFARYYGNDAAVGHVFVLMNMAIAAAEVAVGLALLSVIFKHKKSVDSTKMDMLKW